MNLVRGYRFFSDEECDALIRYCNDKEKELVKYHQQHRDPSGKACEDIIPVTQRYHSIYNFFVENPHYIDRLIACVAEVLPELEFPIAVQSWVNIYRKGQGIKWHSHAGKNGYSFSANVFLGGPTTPGIYYSVNPDEIFNVENERGSMHLFPNSLNHKVPPNDSNQKRYTIGITIHGYGAIDRSLVEGSALNAEHRETIILSRR